MRYSYVSLLKLKWYKKQRYSIENLSFWINSSVVIGKLQFIFNSEDLKYIVYFLPIGLDPFEYQFRENG